MATLTQSQIYTIALLTGLPNPRVMAAVAMGESSGRVDVVNSIGCVGLWQINQPVHVKEHPTWTQDWLKNPINNAQAAKVIYQSQGLSAWEAYTDGSYAKFLSAPVTKQTGTIDQASVSTGQPQIVNAGWWNDFWDGFKKGWNTGPGPSIGDPNGADASPIDSVGSVAEGVLGLAESIQKAGSWISKAENWVRIGYVAGGGLIVIFALYTIAAPAIAKAAPQAQLVKSLIPSGAAKTSSKKTTKG